MRRVEIKLEIRIQTDDESNRTDVDFRLTTADYFECFIR